jgi:two-component system alkaline phosphatase synthesis response regulator PhoP
MGRKGDYARMKSMEKIVKEKFKIAVVEDDKVISKTLKEALEDAGFDVMQAYDGLAGLEMIFSKKPDLVLLDIAMPNMDGIAILKKLRESDTDRKNIPVIFLTNLNADDKIMNRIVGNEPSYYLVKSDYKIDEVIEKVKDCLKI